jgi:four helix bundle protein
MAIQSFRDLDGWKCAMEVVVVTYRVTAGFPHSERFGLVSQMRRAAVSIPSNIAEAHGRRQEKGVVGRGSAYFLTIAIGSLNELDTQLELATRLGFLNAANAEPLAEWLARTRQLLWGMRRHALRGADPSK